MGLDARNWQSVFVEFDARQVQVRTDIAEVADFVRSSHAAMLVSRLRDCIGELVVTRDDDNYWINGDSFEARGPSSVLFALVKRQIVTFFVENRPDLVWLHAAVVHRPSGSLVIAAPSGEGKSTLAAFLCRSGWGFMSDEVAPIATGSTTVFAYPRTPTRRLNPGRELEKHEIARMETEQWSVPEESIQREASAVRAIVLPRFSSGSASILRRLARGEASVDLLQNVLNFAGNGAMAVATVAQLARSVPVHSLSYGDGEDAARVLHTSGDGLFE